ncbi:unnamed protein product [Dracunculus medinensis]|uniref:Ribosome-binding factor A n=1 Tax=Dracunculus medinensis TaxID=318479 RepID=A0A0N4UIZ6_DRAME|nr:unnamed protein product [Dracunculus medinensis]
MHIRINLRDAAFREVSSANHSPCRPMYMQLGYSREYVESLSVKREMLISSLNSKLFAPKINLRFLSVIDICISNHQRYKTGRGSSSEFLYRHRLKFENSKMKVFTRYTGKKLGINLGLSDLNLLLSSASRYKSRILSERKRQKLQTLFMEHLMNIIVMDSELSGKKLEFSKDTIELLEKSRYRLEKNLSEALCHCTVPHIQFVIDKSRSREMEIDYLFQLIKSDGGYSKVTKINKINSLDDSNNEDVQLQGDKN